MDFASSTRAAENRISWKGIVTKSSVVARRPSKVMGSNRNSLEDNALMSLESSTQTEQLCV